MPNGEHTLGILVAALLLSIGVMSTFPADQATAGERPRVGPVIISPYLGDWNDFTRRLFRAGEFDLAKVHLPPSYGTSPGHVVDLIEDGAAAIMLKTEDCRSDGETTYAHLVDRGFLDLIEANPEIEFVIQVGNEPERCPITMDTYLDGLAEVATQVRPLVDQPNLQWVAGLPMVPATARQVLDDGWVQDYYDGVGTNMLGHYSLLDERNGWHEIVDYVLNETGTDLWITEIGINHAPMDKTEKARRILSYVDQLPADRVAGVTIFSLSNGSRWPQYEISESMIPVFNQREECRYFVATGHWLCDGFNSYWEEHGGLEIFGYPITDEYRDENGVNVQYFERARFEWHPDAWPEQHDVLLGHLGGELIADRRAEEPFQRLEPGDAPGDECRYFPRTGQSLCDQFLLYWDEFGGLPIFGYPLSQAFVEDGTLVQYFERARLEYHPGVWPERYDVLQGLLGVDAVADEGLDEPVSGGH